MQGKDIREHLHAGACVYGSHITVMGNAVAASVLADAGLDFVFLCAEHMPLDRLETAALCCRATVACSTGLMDLWRLPLHLL